MSGSTDPRVMRVQEFFETMSLDSLQQIEQVYAPDARFKDPFNDVRGIAEIHRVFAQIATQVEVPSFGVTRAVCEGDDAFLTWDFGFKMKRWRQDEQVIQGTSHIRFAPDGRVAYHRDYWDAAEELYEKLPVLGILMRWLRRQAAT
ncbi:MAG: nuclear transport factor 2 family protein [Pseudomonadota bacterium]|nr:nuclear transport factor 2 family protein [Pseudomonadota bacterium]